MLQLVWAIGIVVVLLFSFVVLFGAPYLPTLKPQIQAALDMSGVKPGQTLYELGSGDGRVMLAAARRGVRVVGYELNPLLAAFSWCLTLRYRRLVTVRCGNFWHANLSEADVVFVFLLDKYMPRLDKKIIQECSKSVKLVSFAFKIPGRVPTKERQGVYLYSYPASK